MPFELKILKIEIKIHVRDSWLLPMKLRKRRLARALSLDFETSVISSDKIYSRSIEGSIPEVSIYPTLPMHPAYVEVRGQIRRRGTSSLCRYVASGTGTMQYARDPWLDNKGSLMQASVCLCGARERLNESEAEKEG